MPHDQGQCHVYRPLRVCVCACFVSASVLDTLHLDYLCNVDRRPFRRKASAIDTVWLLRKTLQQLFQILSIKIIRVWNAMTDGRHNRPNLVSEDTRHHIA
jgi:hypothetical protein